MNSINEESLWKTHKSIFHAKRRLDAWAVDAGGHFKESVEFI